MDDKVSIVLPTYNGERFITDAIESIIAQTYDNWELIIVNDCSSDGTVSIIEKYLRNDTRIRLINNEKNLKLPNSLNVGFKNAKGNLLTWTSDDNLYFPSAIEDMVNTIKSSGNIMLAYADCNIINEAGNQIGIALLPSPYHIVLGNNIGACFLYTREAYEKVGNYDDDLFLAEDYDYWIRIYQKGEFKHLEKILYSCRRHSASLTSTKKEMIRQQTFKMFEKHFSFLYSDALRNHLEYSFFYNILTLADNNQHQEIYKRIKNLNKIAWLYCKAKTMFNVVRGWRKNNA